MVWARTASHSSYILLLHHKIRLFCLFVSFFLNLVLTLFSFLMSPEVIYAVGCCDEKEKEGKSEEYWKRS